MRYIERIQRPGERLVYSTRIHWIIYLPGALLWGFALVMFVVFPHPILALTALVIALLGSILLFRAWFRRWTTEIDVTDRRIVYKRGLIWRRTVEMNMNKVETVDVDQTIFGRLLNFGDVTIRGTGAGIEPLHTIEDPLKFRNCVTAR